MTKMIMSVINFLNLLRFQIIIHTYIYIYIKKDIVGLCIIVN